MGMLSILMTLAIAPVPGQGPPDSGETPTSTEQGRTALHEATGDATGDDEAPTSTEQGRTPLHESFGGRTRAERMRDTRRRALDETRIDLHLRSFYLDRDRFDGSESSALALGGWVGFKTGHFRERYALGATAYTSQRLYGPEDKDGTGLLQPGQHGYSALGELYGEALLAEGIVASLGRRGLDTPYINRNDARMTPSTFEAFSVAGTYGGSRDQPAWRFGGGYVDEIRPRNADEFISMASAAGAPAGVERGVYVAGFNYARGGLSLGAVDYYSDDILNIAYAEARYALPLSERMRLQFVAQYADQRSIGDDLLGDADSADQWGLKAELAAGRTLVTLAHTRTGDGTDMRSPWGGYPGHTSVQLEDFFRAGEDAWMLRAAYNFRSVPGLSAYGLVVDGSDPDDPAQYAKREYDFNLQWTVPSGPLQGLALRVRYARVAQDGGGGSDENELRLIAYYDPPGF